MKECGALRLAQGNLVLVILQTVGAANPVRGLKHGDVFKFLENTLSNPENEINAAGQERENVAATFQRRTRCKENVAVYFV